MAPDRPSTGRWLSRVLPATLRFRLTLAVLVTNFVVLASATLLLLAAWAAQRPALMEDTARQAVNEALCRIDLEIAHADGITAAFAESVGARDPGQDDQEPSPETLAHAEQYAERVGADVAVWIRADGVVLHQSGDASDVSSLRRLIEDTDPEGGGGLVELSGNRIAAVSLKPITGGAAPEPVGWYATATEVPLPDLVAKGKAFFVVRSRPSSTPVRFREISTAHSGAVLMDASGESVVIRAEMLGADGRPIGWLEILRPWSTENVLPGLFGLPLLVAAGVAVISGLLAGLALTTLFHRPIDTLARHVRHCGHAALEGRPLEPIERDPLLPDEFQDLLDTFDRLIAHLAIRQAELLSAQEETAGALRSLGSVVNDSPEAKILVQDDAVVLANPAASALFGVAAERLSGPVDDVFEGVGLSNEAGHALTLEEAVAAAIERPLILCIARPNESERWVEVRGVVNEGEPRTVLFTARDVTEERRVEALRTEIVSLVSHDLRAPLTVISGYLDMLGQPTDDEARARIVSAARRSADRMSALLEDLLSAARADEPLLPSRLESVSMSALAEEVASSFVHTSSHSVQALVLCEGMVLGEERRLRQVLVNLVTNAIKHAPENSRIDITVSCEEGRVLALVEDEGPGIPEADREHIFERFTRLENDGLGRPGVGLGLYIVRAIVEGHGGTVRVEDRGHAPGARFVVELPAAGGS